MDKSEKIQKRYDRVSKVYDILEQPMEAMAMKRWRLDLMAELNGRVLEVGVGTGKNIQYYPDELDVTAIDFSRNMLAKAIEKAKRFHKNVKLIQMDAQNMDFPDDSFDTVFTTCVFCSVPDPIKGLKEIRRVCKPYGKIIMIEHVRSEKPFVGTIMDLLNPIFINLYGCNINRQTVSNINQAGFIKTEINNLAGDIVKKIQIINCK